MARDLVSLVMDDANNGRLREQTPPPTDSANYYTTPHKNRRNAYVTPYANGDDAARDERLRRDAHEMDYHWIPCKLTEFMDFLPPSNIQIDSTKFETLFDAIQRIGEGNENDISKLLCVALNMYFDDKWDFAFTGAHPSVQDGYLKPDISVNQKPLKGRGCDFSTSEVVMERKAGTQDIFRDNNELKDHADRPYAKEDDASVLARGQLTSATRQIFLHQHRTSVISVFFSQDKVRFIRTERAGGAVSDNVQWRTKDGLRSFVNFFERLHAGSRAQRGHDETVVGAGDDMKEKYRKWAESHSDQLEPLFGPSQKDSRVLQFTDEEGKKYLCDARPIHASQVLLGRASRCFVGMDVDSEEMVLIKDQWRQVAEDLVPEGTTYERLKKVDGLAKYLLTVIEGRDLPDQRTKMHKYNDAARCRPIDRQSADEAGGGFHRIHEYVHHRIIFRTVGNRLLDCTDSRMFLCIMRDVLQAHWLAYKEAKVLHRDVSPSNIFWKVVKSKAGGLLADWDLAKDLTSGKSSRQYITGTWQFISAWLLLPETPTSDRNHSYKDDLESMLWIILYYFLRTVPTSMQILNQIKFVTDLFDSHDEDPATGHTFGGEKKRTFLTVGPVIVFEEHPPVTRLVQGMKNAFEPRYYDSARLIHPDWEEQLDSSSHFLKLLNDAIDADDWKKEDAKLSPEAIQLFKVSRGTKRKAVDAASKAAQKSSRYLLSTGAGESLHRSTTEFEEDAPDTEPGGAQ